LVAVKPAGQSDCEEVERLYDIGHCANRLSIIMPDNNIIRFVRIFAPYGHTERAPPCANCCALHKTP
jgi:hypothetical protein